MNIHSVSKVFFSTWSVKKMTRRLRRRKSSLLIHNGSSSSSSSSTNNGDQSNLLPSQSSSLDECDESATFLEKENFSIDNWKQEWKQWQSTFIQLSLILATIILCFYTYFWFEHFHYHLTRFYANHVDDHHAQHVLGHKLIRNRSHAEAFYWFRRSADQGHPHSAYNLAVGHLSGYRTDVKQGNLIFDTF